MRSELLVLAVEAMAVYFLVLGAHALRRREGLAYFYALLGGLTAVMSWVTDAGVAVEAGGLSFLVGSTVFYSSLLLGVFVVYVFDGPGAARVAISTVAGVSALAPIIAWVLHLQTGLAGSLPLASIPSPDLRINLASIATTIADLLFLAIAWEFLGRGSRRVPLWLRTYLTLLGVMGLDALLFTTGAFAGRPVFAASFSGALISRLLLSLFAFPFLYLYLSWQRRVGGTELERRPVFAILGEIHRARAELLSARHEIAARLETERRHEHLIEELRQALAEVKTLRGFLPICASCKKVRDDAGYWQLIERYVEERSEATFSHGLCPDCARQLFPELAEPPP